MGFLFAGYFPKRIVPRDESCLFRTPDDAFAGAKEFSKGNWEPGPYCIMEVLRSEAGTARSGEMEEE